MDGPGDHGMPEGPIYLSAATTGNAVKIISCLIDLDVIFPKPFWHLQP
jgi:hypothetical protein